MELSCQSVTRRDFFASLAGGALASAATPRGPNIVFLLVDDAGWRDFGCYGNEFYETPNFDRLAAEGVKFTNAYAACPVCSPTRASIMTGKYPARLHLTDFIPGRKQWPTAKLLVPRFEQQLPLREFTVAELLKPLGYRSASIGKWHLGDKGFWPENQGFDLNVAGTKSGSTASYFGPFNLPNLRGGTKDDYLTEKLTEAAEQFIETVAPSGPFFLYLSEFTVHIPLQARAAMVDKYRRKLSGRESPNPIYAAMVESFDIAVGRIRRKLEQMNVADRTIIIATSDNGGLRYEARNKRPLTDNSPLRAGKGHVYEGGIRVPLIVYWPGVTLAGSETDVPVSSIDFLPTMMEMAGAKARRAVDGVSLVPLLRRTGAPRREALYWHYPHYSSQGGVPSSAVRRGDWKLIEFYEDGRLELFNLREDIGEHRNLVVREPRKAAELHHLLRKWRKDVAAAMPTPNPAYDPARADQGLTGTEPAIEPVR